MAGKGEAIIPPGRRPILPSSSVETGEVFRGDDEFFIGEDENPDEGEDDVKTAARWSGVRKT